MPHTSQQQRLLNAVRNSLLLLLACQALPALAQTFSGTVYDQGSDEALPFVNILVKGTQIGAFSDADGHYVLEVGSDSATLVFNYLGYESVELPLVADSAEAKVYLASKDLQMEEVTIVPDYSYDRRLFKLIQAHKAENNPENHDLGMYMDYSRTFVCLSNLRKEVLDKRIFKDDQEAFIAESDTSLLMPIFFSEEVTQHEAAQEEIIRSRTNGILKQLDHQVQSLVTEKLTTRMNFYDEQLTFLNRGFPGPLARGARMFYNIYVVDSAQVDGTKHYKFDFYPKNERNITFRGSFWVEDSSFALTKVEATLPNSANLNFVKDLEVAASYRKGPEGDWFYDSQSMQMKVALNKKEKEKKQKSSYLVRKTLDFQSPSAWKQQDASTAAGLASMEDDEVFSQLRRTDMNSFEEQALGSIQTFQNNQFVKSMDRLAALSFTGYYNVGKFDLGPLYDAYRRNAVEGHRITLNGRTSEQLSKTFSVGGYLGYGFTSKAFKYGAEFNLNLPTRNRSILSLRYSDDFYALSRNKYIEFVRENPFSQGDGNPISTFSATPNPYTLGLEHLSLSLQLQTKKDIGFLIRPFHNTYKGTSQLQFTEGGKQEFQNTGLLLDARFSFHQKYDDIYFQRFYYGNGKPVIHLTAELGQNRVDNKASNYAHFQASVKNRFTFGPTSLRMLVDAGYILGEVPYPLLHMPRGAQSLGLGRYNYSLLNHASFASDMYTNAYFSFNGGGILFSRIPLLNRLDLRESASFKAFYGRLNGQHTDIYKLPNGILKAPNDPYMEVGVGVSNIFKFLRVEYVRRLHDSPGIDQVSSKHGVRARFQVSF